MRRERGWSLIELSISLALISAVAGVAAALTSDARRASALAQAYETDVTSTRRVLDAMERDIRQARDVTCGVSSLGVSAGGRDVEWRLRDGALLRDGEVVARNVATFASARTGSLVDVEIELGRRSPDATRSARVATSVRLRAPREDVR